MGNQLTSNNSLTLERLRRTPELCVCKLVLLLFLAFVAPAFATDSPSLDLLMGGQRRINHQKRIESLVFENGKSYGWEDFSAWGKEIFLTGFVKNPPTGPSPSKPVSELFKCAKCHNYEREDPDLSVQDPEARALWIEKTGEKVYLLQGATMWGVVNRETFYPDYFSIYHNLCVPKGDEPSWLPCGPIFGICRPGCRTMDPDSLADSTQVCSNYCSVGRYLKIWELHALLAFFWDQEIKLGDLGLSPEQSARMKKVLTSPSPNPQEVKKLRGILAGKYKPKAGNTYRGIPKIVKDASEGALMLKYADEVTFTGDPARGQKLWPLSCGRCHETKEKPLNPEKAKKLTEDLEKFHKMLAKGTRRSFKRYMPNFTLERLSRQQSADILEHLRHFSE